MFTHCMYCAAVLKRWTTNLRAGVYFIMWMSMSLSMKGRYCKLQRAASLMSMHTIAGRQMPSILLWTTVKFAAVHTPHIADGCFL